MQGNFEMIYQIINGSINWLMSWTWHGIPFLDWLIGLAVVSTVMKFIFG